MRRFVAGELQLAPPTHRTLEQLAAAGTAAGAVAMTATACLDPICPQLVKHVDARGETVALALPGDRGTRCGRRARRASRGTCCVGTGSCRKTLCSHER